MYVKMLDLIDFSDSDTLFFIGDAADRGPRGVEVWQDVMARSNVRFIRGNHEQMCLDAMQNGLKDGDALELWMLNGGGTTIDEIMSLQAEERERILRFLDASPLFINTTVDGKRFHFVHGLPSYNNWKRLWGRPTAKTRHWGWNTTAIIGHTPTRYITGLSEPMRIWHGKKIIDIDCGCGQNEQYSQLACLRLEDMKEWYI